MIMLNVTLYDMIDLREECLLWLTTTGIVSLGHAWEVVYEIELCEGSHNILMMSRLK